ncbi:MAG: GAF domain-containing protein [Proteobacteria bacterium]|nr:GAF domain-containing protein [Pseudomonadota bacterium]
MNEVVPNAPTSERLARLEAVQAVVLDISHRAARCNDLHGFFATVHAGLRRLMRAENYGIALYDAAAHGVHFVYWADEKDPTPDPGRRYPLRGEGESPTAQVIRSGEPRLFTAEQWAAKRAKNKRFGSGARPEHWVGMPLVGNDGRTFGAMVVQSYDRGFRYSEEDIALVRLMSEQVADAVEHVQYSTRLEQAIAERTHSLEREIEERRRAERLQHALYEISALSVKDIGLDAFYAQLHRILGGLMYARNLAVMLYYNDEHDLVGFPYSVDEKDPDLPKNFRRPAGHGLTGFVLRTRMPQRIDQQRYQALLESAVIHHVLGNVTFTSWIGAPMIHQDKVLGVLMLQSYDPKIGYDDDDLALLTFVAEHIAAALSRKQADEALRSAHAHLASGNAALQEKNRELEMTLMHLGMAQGELVRQEKLASLGALVASIAHEVNTPLGICTTAVSLMLEESRRLRDALPPAALEDPAIKAFLESSDELLGVLANNTLRASGLIRSFKQVAVDQSSEQVRDIVLAESIEDTLRSIRPKFKRTGHTIVVDCDPSLRLRSIPGALSQVLTNLVLNSVAHAFEHTDHGHIAISVAPDDAGVTIDYRDDGSGLSPQALHRLFEPFYTTKRGQGGSGLGTNIVHNLVTTKLGGTISVDSKPGHGLHYAIHLPAEPPEHAPA